MENKLQKAYFAAGCFWGVEYCFQNLEGVVSTRVGYMGGGIENPTYEDVCTGRTGHAEALEVTFDESRTDFKTLAKAFFEIHDPTQVNRQGPDIGEQYRSAIFYLNDEQRKVSEELMSILKQKGIDAVTTIVPAQEFYPAEGYHQKYYSKSGRTPYCHVRRKIFE